MSYEYFENLDSVARGKKKQVGSYRIDIVIVTTLYGYVQTRGRFRGWLRSQLAPTKKSVVWTQLGSGSGASLGSQLPKIWPHKFVGPAPLLAQRGATRGLAPPESAVWTQLTWGPGYLHDLSIMQILDCRPISFNQNYRKWSDLHEDDYAYNVIDLQPHNSQQVIKHEFNVILCFNDNFPSDYSKKFTFDHVSVLNVSVEHLTCLHEEKGALSNKKCTL